LVDEITFLISTRKSIIVSLKNRKDVVLKTVLRSIKKRIHSTYHILYPQPRFRDKKKQILSFENSVRKLVQEIVLPSSMINLTLDNEDYSEVVAYMFSYFIHPKLAALSSFKKEVSEAVEPFLKKYRKCCREYSHFLFNSLIKEDLFKVFLTSYDALLTSDLTKDLNIPKMS